MPKFSHAAAIAALGLAMPGIAGAATIVTIPATATGSGSGTLTSGAGASTGTVDLSSYLIDASGRKFAFANLSVAFSAYSNRDTTTQVYLGDNPHYAYRQEAYRCGFFGQNTCYRTVQYVDYTTPVYVYYDRQVEQLKLSVGGSQASRQTAYQTGANSGEFFGDVSTGVTVNDADLAAINSTGFVNFSLQNVLGSPITVSGGSVTFDLVAVPAAAAAVPEAATWAMMIVGMGAIGVSMRRRRQPGRVTAAA